MADQLFTNGDVSEINGETFECVSVSYRETNGEKHNFIYHFRLKSELDAEREAELEAASAVDTETAEPVNQPEEPKEETQYVK